MKPVLWTSKEIEAALGCAAEGRPSDPIKGISIDTRTLEPGDLFVALKHQRDGHDFVAEAARKESAGALVTKAFVRPKDVPATFPLYRCADPQKGLETLAKAGRDRLSPKARVVAVTGSAGKTTTKEMLRVALSAQGRTFASMKSYNNHWGVPLTLSRMPADSDFVVVEIGMNHPGEIAPLSRLARPHVAIVTTVLPVHLEHFPDETGIADAKAEIFNGLEPGGVAILNRDNVHFDRLTAAARRAKAKIMTFGHLKDADCRLLRFERTPTAGRPMSLVEADLEGQKIVFDLGFSGEQMGDNALAVLLALRQVGALTPAALSSLADMSPEPGRGALERLTLPGGPLLLIDESYNANPASMEKAIATALSELRPPFKRLVLVLGDMLELGKRSRDFHRDLSKSITAIPGAVVFAAGTHMQALYDALPAQQRGGYATSSKELAPVVLEALKGGDVVMVKGSAGSHMGEIITAIRSRFAATAG